MIAKVVDQAVDDLLDDVFLEGVRSAQIPSIQRCEWICPYESLRFLGSFRTMINSAIVPG